jgi:hypothetical protein
MTSKTALRIGLCGLAMSLGCNVSTMIGEIPDGAPPNQPPTQTSYEPVGTSGHTCSPPEFAGDHPFDFPAGLEGVWTGYVEGGTLGLNSDAVRLTLDHAASGASQIHIVFGAAAPPPPATSATEFYPPGTQSMGFGAPLYHPIEGFAYTAHNVNWEAFGQQWRLRFLKIDAEPWGSWCRLQSSYANVNSGGVSYSCMPNTGYMSAPGSDGNPVCALLDSSGHAVKTVPCAQVQLCQGSYVCTCDMCGCDEQGQSFAGVPSGPGTYDILFDANTTTASGSSLRLMHAPTN